MANSDTSAGDLRLPDRPAALAALERLLLESWRGFDHAREGQPPLSEDLRERLGRPLPSGGMDAVEGLEIAGAVLDASIAQPRPRFLAYVGSSGLEIGVLGDALMACHDVNVAVILRRRRPARARGRRVGGGVRRVRRRDAAA